MVLVFALATHDIERRSVLPPENGEGLLISTEN
jgi:hypothetical protein